MIEAIVTLMLATALFFMLVAAMGFVRLPDLFCRLHVTGIIDTVGVPLVLLAIAVHEGVTLTAGKLLLAICFVYMTAPLIGHLLARAAVEAGHLPILAEGTTEGLREEIQEETPEDGGGEPGSR